MASLSSIANNQLSGLTRRRLSYPSNQTLISEIPAAITAEQNKLTQAYREAALKQDAEQSAATLAQSAEQFDKNQALQQQIADTQNAQARKATAVQGAGTAISLAALTKDAWLPAVKETILPAIKNAAGKVVSTISDAAAGASASGLTTSTSTGAASGLTSTANTAATTGTATEATAGTTSTAAGTGASTGTTSLSSVAGPIAIIGAAETAKSLWGGQGTDWDEKTTQQKVVSDPVTAGLMASPAVMNPGDPLALGTSYLLMNAPEDTLAGKVYKTMAGAEETVMKPINWIFGNK